MGELKMPPRGKGAAMLQELNAEHASMPEEVSNDATNVTKLQGTPITTNERRKKQPEDVVRQTSSEEGPRQERLEHALKLGEEDELSVVTVRVSARLNEYMDRYVQRVNQTNPKRKYRKQDAVLEAFAAFYADHPMPPAPADDEL
jgi:hypothetical protein